jgi:hypothetical protein
MNAEFPVLVKARGVILAALLVASCGIDQGGYREPIANSPQTIIVSGPIDAFGSVHVNGLVLDTSRADIRMDGRAATQADLRVGQMVRAVASVSGGTVLALSIDHEENVVGPVAALDAAAGEMTVLGQRVRVTAATRFDGLALASLADLALGDRVAVSGIALPQGGVLATYVARVATTAPYQVTTSITTLSTAALSFALGSLTIDYSRAAVLELPSGMPSQNLIVEVTGGTLSGGVLIADRVRALPLLPGTFTAAATALTSSELAATALAGAAAPGAVDFVGVVSGQPTANSLSIDDLEVALTATTIVVGSPNGFAAGAVVEVEGRIVSFGRVEATRIELK